MTISTALLFGGLLSFALAIFHCSFYNYLKWEDDLKNVTVSNGKIFMTLHIALIAIFLFFAFLSFVYNLLFLNPTTMPGAG